MTKSGSESLWTTKICINTRTAAQIQAFWSSSSRYSLYQFSILLKDHHHLTAESGFEFYKLILHRWGHLASSQHCQVQNPYPYFLNPEMKVQSDQGARWRFFSQGWSRGLNSQAALPLAASALISWRCLDSAGGEPSSPPAAWLQAVCFSLSVKFGFLCLSSPLNEVCVPGHFLLPAALVEFRARRCWEVRWSSEEH